MNNWITFSRVCVGSSHLSSQLPCQDALRELNTPQLVLSVAADGVGSLCNSHIAADAAVSSTVNWFEENYRDLSHPNAADLAIRTGLIPALQRSIALAAQDNGVLPDTMDCNLAFACILPAYAFAIWGVLGDGAVCVFRRDRQYVLSAANSISANATETILQRDAAERLRLGACPLADGQLLGFLVTSDGLEGEIYDKTSMLMRRNAELYFNAMLLPTEQEREAAILGLLERRPRELDDDISLSIISSAQRTQSITLPPPPSWLCSCGSRNSLNSSACTNCRTSFQKLYEGVDFGSSMELFFLDLNQDPQRESGLLYRNRPKPIGKNIRLSAGQKVRRNVSAGTSGSAGQEVLSVRSNVHSPKKESLPKAPPAGEENEPSVDTPLQLREPQIKDLSGRSVRISTGFIAACLAAVWMIGLSILLFYAHHRISVLEDRLSSQTQVLAPGEPAIGSYIVTATSAKLLRMEDGEVESVLTRLDEGSLLERLDHQELLVGDVVYIRVRTESGLEGWCNLDSLTEAVPQETHTGE